jgi:hypothetical protein
MKTGREKSRPEVVSKTLALETGSCEKGTAQNPFHTPGAYANSQLSCKEAQKSYFWNPHKQRAGNGRLARFGLCGNLWVRSQQQKRVWNMSYPLVPHLLQGTSKISKRIDDPVAPSTATLAEKDRLERELAFKNAGSVVAEPTQRLSPADPPTIFLKRSRSGAKAVTLWTCMPLPMRGIGANQQGDR